MKLQRYGRKLSVLVPKDDGDYVKYSDVTALEADNARLRERNKVLWGVAYAATRVEALTKENFPHRNPEWVFNHPDSPIKLAMNSLLESINKLRDSDAKLRAALAQPSEK